MTERKTWSTEEDNFIRLKVEHNANLTDKDRFKWGDIADLLNKKFPDSQRSGKQCRERWHNQLDPNILHKEWTKDQEKRLFELQKKLGNKWAEIASNMKGRTDNNVKNYFYSTLRKSLRKLNTFISLHRQDLKAVKEFKQSSLSKLLAVADHKFDKKINIKKVTAETQAVDIKNLLIQITGLEAGETKHAALFFNLVKKLQDWNKCCKKKKGKKKQEVEIGDEEGDEESEDEEEMADEEEEQKQKKTVRNKKSQQQDLQRSGLSERQIRMNNRSRSRNNNKPGMEKKQSNVSKGSRKSKGIKKAQKQQKKPKQSVQTPKVPETPQLVKRGSSKQQSYLSGSAFLDLGRSSLDLGKFQRRSSSSELKDSSNIFKSFVFDNNQNEQGGNSIDKWEKSQQKNNESKGRTTRSMNQPPPFLDTIKEISFLKKESLKSNFIEDFLQDDDYEGPFGIKMLKRQSSRRQLPMMKDESFIGFGELDQSFKFQPQIKKLRSWRQDSSNFELKYDFGDDK